MPRKGGMAMTVMVCVIANRSSFIIIENDANAFVATTAKVINVGFR
ncbi:hypothetical protein KP509_30G042300 [Ceratopteris richardii]|uniref:Uncharacterized protein n=1 Tax=Ceratopteris richardii TaxID=49495 RepID=A0A8T2R2U4_CERRI|nr:hypothetical protein KP509_30G042300 [Ceratopteris richardii]